ncbi:MAG TPA: helix-hairpin-helix domain-containing protein, partial [Chitinophagaceae bacterium]|nr:helix-hairpin-helix domain-containing protein [Chitinophagaceae bacterium]
MDNNALADQLTLLSKLMDIHGENSFKTKAYAAAAFALEKLPQPVVDLPKEKIAGIRGIGDSAGKKIIELLETGELKVLQELISQTPEGVLEMMTIKGLGPKKINVLWKSLHIDTIENLQQACEQNKIAEKKGFGEKTQQNILEAIQYLQENSGKYLYAQVEDFADALQAKLDTNFPKYKSQRTGLYRRQWDVLDAVDWVTTIPYGDLKKFLIDQTYLLLTDT